MNNKGFIALISIILISAGLLIIVLEVSASAYFIQEYMQQTLYKEQSLYAAQSCMEIALLQYEEHSDYRGNEIKRSGTYHCTIFPFIFMGNEIEITTQARVENTQTTLKRQINNE